MAKKAAVDQSSATEGMGTILTVTDFARLAGVKPATIHQFRWRGILPPPDGYAERTPYWRPETVENWLANRRRAENGRPRQATGPTE